MHLSPKSRTAFAVRGQLILTVVLAALSSGCTTVYPEVHRKSLHELYYEAVSASNNTPDRVNAMMAGSTGMPMHHMALPPAVMEVPGTILTPVHDMDNQYYGVPQVVEPPTTIPLLPLDGEDVGAQASGWSRPGQGSAKADGDVTTISHSSPTVVSSPPLVTEFLEDTDVRQAIQSIAAQAEVSVIVDEQVGGVVSAVIEDQTFDSALRRILMPLGLVFKQISPKEYIVGVADPSSPLFSKLSERVEFRPMHLAPEELFTLIPERDQKFLNVVDGRNRILIEAPPEMAQSIMERLQQFDSPIPQVELEAIVCVISPDHQFQSGLDWGHAATLNGSEILNVGMAGLAFTGAGSGAGASNAFSDFAVTSAFVKLLAQEGYLAIRAAPRVTAQDGKQATIAITRESYFSTQPQSDNAFFRQDIEQVQAGIELDITPIVRGNNITVQIEKAEVSEDLRTSQLSSNITENPFPQINRRSVSTTVHVKDGETIVIGGLVQRQTVDRIARVPVLGSIPGLGRMFQTVEQKEQDAEVIIFISPRLVHSSSCPPTL